MSRKELRKVIQEFADECDKFAKAWRAKDTEPEHLRQSAESRIARAQVLEAHRDWANNLISKI